MRLAKPKAAKDMAKRVMHSLLKGEAKTDLAPWQTANGIVKFVREVLGVNGLSPDDDNYLAPYQEEILRAFAVYHKIAVRGPHGIGKTTIASWCILWVLCVFETDIKIPTTASVHRQLTHYLWPEVHKWATKADLKLFGITLIKGDNLLSSSIKLEGKEAFISSSNKPEQIEGVHGTVIAYIFDESKAIDNEIFDAAEGAFSTAGKDTGKLAFALAISTPGQMSGRFFDIHMRRPGFEDWWVKHVTIEEAIAAKRISRQWVEQRKLQWGEDSIVFQNRVLGEFSASSEEIVIPLTWLELAIERYNTCSQEELELINLMPLYLGADIARAGEDRTVLTLIQGYRVIDIQDFSKENTMQSVGRIIAMIKGDKHLPIGVDVIGVGAGVVDRLAEQGYNVIAVNAAERSEGVDRSSLMGFVNTRAEYHWLVRDNIDPTYNPDFQIPLHDRLKTDLLAPKYWYSSNGSIQIEAKPDIKKRLGFSPDFSDSLALALYARTYSRIQIW